MENTEKPVVDLNQLRELIGDDKEMEKSLIELFLSTSLEDLSYLEQNCKDGEDEEWKRHAHSLKGSSRNIGAAILGDICAQAQDSYNLDANGKKEIYAKVQAEFNRAKEYLSKV